MTEAEWLSCTDPARMLECLPRDGYTPTVLRPPWPFKISYRKLRLFACACCRQVWDKLTDDAPCQRCHGTGNILRVVEDGSAYGHAVYGDCPDCSDSGRTNRSRRAVEVTERYADGSFRSSKEGRAALIPAARDWLSSTINSPTPDLSKMVPCHPEAHVAAYHAVNQQDIPNAAALLRDICGNPFRPVMLPRICLECNRVLVWSQKYDRLYCRDCGIYPAMNTSSGFETPPCPWLTWTVSRLAQSIYDERAFDLMPLLGDAMEDAGCEDEAMLMHCRGKELHVRGCWVVDLLLGKE